MENSADILIVEDSPTQAMRLRHVLQGGGYVVRVADNGAKGLASAKAEKPSLIISDVMMPEMDGYELCRQIKRDETLKDVPVILLTTLSDPGDVIRSLQCGADNFLTKPYVNEQLLQRVHHILVNTEMRKAGRAQVAVEVFFQGTRHTLTSDRIQIIDLLLSTFEAAVLKNRHLEKVEQELSRQNVILEEKVRERTAELAAQVKRLDTASRAGCVALWERDILANSLKWSGVVDVMLGFEDGAFPQTLQAWEESIHPEDRQRVMRTLEKHLLDGTPYQEEYRVRRKDSSYVWWHDIGECSRAESGQAVRMSGACVDITERKRAEQDRIARQAADQANQAKSGFLANMSHEIRTPLNAIIGFARILERDASLTARQAEHVQTITRSGRHLLELINDILDMSRIESGRLGLSITDFCLHDLLDDLSMMFRSRAEAKGLQLIVERHESVPRYVSADEGKLRQVVVNLMGNAVKFTKTGGVGVRVRADAAPGDSAGDKEALRLLVEVEDTGPGIPDEDLNNIFESFRQSDEGLKAGGTGLGLAISRKLVEMMGGELTVVSEVGKGSCFRFHVPVETTADMAAQEAVQEKQEPLRVIGLEPGTGPFRVLVVDDNKDNRDLLYAMLEPVGFEVQKAVNGQEALEVFEGWSPHAVLMDMRMPVLDGYEATRRIKATAKGRVTPVIAVTASVFEDDKEAVLATGMDGYVRKPFRPEELFEALGKSLGLSYVYAEEAEKPRSKTRSLTREDLASLPEELVRAMRQAVEAGEMARLKELIAEVEKVNADTARGLLILAGNYDYEKLGKLLEI